MTQAPSEPLFSLAGKVACVTGASSGLGRASATILALAGARVVGVARREDQLLAWSENTDGETAIHAADLLVAVNEMNPQEEEWFAEIPARKTEFLESNNLTVEQIYGAQLAQ